jgi:(1->4)-alpha-D-glucan 1-alpha-D-glucosylmutase
MTLPISATYRLQLHSAFGFAAARALVDYLDDLGISHAYSSPYLSAEPGSTHGYNLVDPKVLSAEIGSEGEYVAWTETLASRGMSHIVDFVPNHMAASVHNAWWVDVLENGPSSIYADHFDIEWHPPKDVLENKVLLPILGAQYGEVLEKGELRLERRGGAFFIHYWERALPANPRSMWPVLERAVLRTELSPEDPRHQDFESIVTGLRNLPSRTEVDPDRQRERAREKEVLKRRLATLVEDERIAKAIDDEIAEVNGKPGNSASFDELDRLLGEQSYRLAFWRVATDEINYRRFFDVNELAAIRMENDAVFNDAHELLLRLFAEGRVAGVRLDHTDGLYDPAAYFVKLRTTLEEARRARNANPEDLYIVAEKILSTGEELPESWKIEGTTGYDFLVQASGVFVDASAEKAFTTLWNEVSGDTRTFAEHALQAKRAIMRSSLSSEIYMLAIRLERIAMRDRRSRDFTFAMLHHAVRETIAAFPVYRTYLRPDGSREPNDEQIIVRAARSARRQSPEVSPLVFDYLRDVLLLKSQGLDDADRAARLEFAMRFQQITGPVTAKSVEDTSFYSYARFVALNEVGGAPERFGTSVAELHAHNDRRLAKWPHAMTATGTHDTKRGEDVRARLAVLTEIPDQWKEWVGEWLEIARRFTSVVEDENAPNGTDQYLFFQTALGAYPLDGDVTNLPERLVDYAIKAAREAKLRTSWLSADEGYEQALRGFVTGMLGDPTFAKSLGAKADCIATCGASNGLAQVVLKIAAPGVPDTYQGSELWDLRLVDPDNRTPVDYETRRNALRSIEGAKVADLLAAFRDGRIKLHVLRAGLRLRREKPRIFLEGGYEPIDAGESIVAFARPHAEGTVVAAVTRQPWHVTRGQTPWAIGGRWAQQEIISIPKGSYRDVLTGTSIEIGADGIGISPAKLFAELPVALLTSR